MAKSLLTLMLVVAFAWATVGADSCGTTDTSGGGSGSASKGQERAKRRAAKRKAARSARARAAARAKRRRARTAARPAAPTPSPAPAPRPAPAASNCDPNYSGCLDRTASDYDCTGGSGDGPKYTGQVTVKGVDHFDLDRDGDGIGCD